MIQRQSDDVVLKSVHNEDEMAYEFEAELRKATETENFPSVNVSSRPLASGIIFD